MKTVILCGGKGTRLRGYGQDIPKALLEIGDNPIIWHILQLYSGFGINDFVLCLGFLGDKIKKFFIEQRMLNEDLTLNLKENKYNFLTSNNLENWKITFADTGLETNTGGRIKKIKKYLDGDDVFCATYGDGLANVDIKKLIEFHKSHGKIATLTSVIPESNFGLIKFNKDNIITEFQEKPKLEQWINGGFFVFNKEIFDYLGNNSVLEKEPFEKLAKDRQLVAFKHTGFWKCMDTYKDNIEFNKLWDEENVRWRF
ncbi:MAG: glucose-1-phosphate cytidylyltransferase [Acidobacteriota bacterium]|jgi:glucose-1-phosphate cytidylyltransferase|nr:glucose-1-phosphate cytidylyltransferase [Acidobacteriota bacterium]